MDAAGQERLLRLIQNRRQRPYACTVVDGSWEFLEGHLSTTHDCWAAAQMPDTSWRVVSAGAVALSAAHDERRLPSDQAQDFLAEALSQGGAVALSEQWARALDLEAILPDSGSAA